MDITLEDLQDSININGVVSEYQNGANQWGTKKSPEADLYNAMLKNYSTVMKQLSEMVPNDEEGDSFLDFIGRKK